MNRGSRVTVQSSSVGPIQFGSVRFGPVQFSPVQFGPAQFGQVWSAPLRSAPAQFGPIQLSGPARPGTLQAQVRSSLEHGPLTAALLVAISQSMWPIADVIHFQRRRRGRYKRLLQKVYAAD